MKKQTLITAVTLMLVMLSGCVTPQTVAPVIKAQVATYKEPPNSVADAIRELSVKQTRKQIVKQALSGLGVRYVFSGMSRYGWDCSGFTAYVFEKFGITLEHSATKQAYYAKPTHKPVAGDLVAFSKGGYWYYHVGIYLGHGKVVDANSYYGRTLIEPITNYKGDKITFIDVLK